MVLEPCHLQRSPQCQSNDLLLQIEIPNVYSTLKSNGIKGLVETIIGFCASCARDMQMNTLKSAQTGYRTGRTFSGSIISSNSKEREFVRLNI